MFLVNRNASCNSCFTSNQLGPFSYSRVFYWRDISARFDCSRVDEPGFIYMPRKAQQMHMCDMWLAWPNSTTTVGGACSGGWCAGIAGTRVTGVCQPKG